MTLLAQQELVEVPPTRRLIVPAGHVSWWGVDVSVRRISIAWVTPERRRGVIPISFPALDGGARLAHAFELIRDEVAARAHALPLPGLVLVEQPSGKQPNMPLAYMVGVVQAGVYAGAVAGGAVSPRVETVTSAHWKKVSCGRGDIYKPKLTEDREYGVLTWARANGYIGRSWDDADAWGIAEAARRDVTLEPR